MRKDNLRKIWIVSRVMIVNGFICSFARPGAIGRSDIVVSNWIRQLIASIPCIEFLEIASSIEKLNNIHSKAVARHFALPEDDDCTWPLWCFWMDWKRPSWHRPKICRDTNRLPVGFSYFARSPNRCHTKCRTQWTFRQPADDSPKIKLPIILLTVLWLRGAWSFYFENVYLVMIDADIPTVLNCQSSRIQLRKIKKTKKKKNQNKCSKIEQATY